MLIKLRQQPQQHDYAPIRHTRRQEIDKTGTDRDSEIHTHKRTHSQLALNPLHSNTNTNTQILVPQMYCECYTRTLHCSSKQPVAFVGIVNCQSDEAKMWRRRQAATMATAAHYDGWSSNKRATAAATSSYAQIQILKTNGNANINACVACHNDT